MLNFDGGESVEHAREGGIGLRIKGNRGGHTYALVEIYHMHATETWYKLCAGIHWYKSPLCNYLVSE